MARGGRVIYKRAGGRKGKPRSRAADDDDVEEDQDYVFGEEDEEDSESFEESYASSLDASEEEFEFGESSSGSDEEEEEIELEEEEEEEEEEEIELVRSKPRRGASNGWRTIKKPRVLNDEEEVTVTKKRARSGSRRKKSRDSDYEVEEDDDDEDFSPDEDEDEEEDVSFIYERRSVCRRKGSSKQDRKKRKSGVLKQKRKKKTSKAPARKRRRRAWISDEDDDDFMVKDRIAVDKKRTTKSKKGRKKKTAASRVARKVSLVDSETSDFEYMTSDDDFVEKDSIRLDNQKKKSKKGRKKTAAPRTKRKRSSSSVGSDSESSDCDYVISEEELRDLGVAKIASQPQPERVFARRKAEEKGKEKEADEPGKQVCGICLSEEQKGTVQGVLNCCAHYFCFACIMEWSKVESRCPVCKRRFMTISKSSRSDPGFGLRKAVIRVQKRDQVYQPSEEEIRGLLDPYENVVCMECQQGGDDHLMLLCDICDSPAHTYCVGLGREVPEGNWYCELCRSAGEGSSHSQVQDTLTDQGASSVDLFPGGWETEDVSRDMHTSRNSQMSVPLRGQSSLRIDLNVSPRHFTEDDYGAASQANGGGASTLSGRRAIQRHIRILLSNSRPRQIFARVNVPLQNGESDAITSGIEQSGEAPHGTEGVNPLHPVSNIEQHQQNFRPFQSGANLAACTYSEGNSFRHVEGAKEEVQSIVKRHLRNLCRDFPLDHATFKEVARRSTHTILAACGIEHRSRMVAAPVQAPSNCHHKINDDESPHLMKDCCLSCFSSFVKDVVLKLMHTTNRS